MHIAFRSRQPLIVNGHQNTQKAPAFENTEYMAAATGGLAKRKPPCLLRNGPQIEMHEDSRNYFSIAGYAGASNSARSRFSSCSKSARTC